MLSTEQLRASIRTVPDFPKPGIQFRDISTLLANPAALHTSVTLLAREVRSSGATLVAGMEARGFIFGAAVAIEAGVGFVPIRKPGKLPVETIGVDYALEYGAATQLVRMTSADVATALFVVDLPDLGGATRLRNAGISVTSLLSFEGE